MIKREFNELFQESSFKDESKNLRRLNLLISQRCPLGCLYCYTQKGTYGNPSYNKVIENLNILKGYGQPHAVIFNDKL